MYNHDLREATKNLLNFLDSRECGESYWIDDEGNRHTADIGYVSEFLEDLRTYLNGDWRKPERNPRFNFRIIYKLLGNSINSELFCENYEEFILNDKKAIDAINGLSVTHIPLSRVSFLKIYATETEDCVFAYFAPL